MGLAKSMEKVMVLQRSRYGTALGAVEKYGKVLKNKWFCKGPEKGQGGGQLWDLQKVLKNKFNPI